MTVEGAGQVGVSTQTDREHFYVMVSRAKAGAVIHAVRSEVATSGSADPCLPGTMADSTAARCPRQVFELCPGGLLSQYPV